MFLLLICGILSREYKSQLFYLILRNTFLTFLNRTKFEDAETFLNKYKFFSYKLNEKEIIKDPVLDYVHQSDYLDLEVIQKSEFKNVEDKYSILYKFFLQ